MRFHLTLVLVTLAASQMAKASCGTIKVSKGDIRIEAAANHAVKPAPEGTKVCAGDTIISAADSRAKVEMEDGNVLNVSPDTKLLVETYQYNQSENKKKVLLNVLQGKVRATTAKEHMYNDKARDGQANTFEIRTKSAVAGVRGTDFAVYVEAASGKTEVVTFRGQVSVGQINATGVVVSQAVVQPGQKLEVRPNAPMGTPVVVPPAELSKVNNETKAEPASTQQQPAAPAAAPAKDATSKEKDRNPSSAPAPAPAPAPGSTQPAAPSAANPPAAPPAAPLAPPKISLGTPPASDLVVVPKLPVLPTIPAPPQQVIDSIQSRAAKVNITINRGN